MSNIASDILKKLEAESSEQTKARWDKWDERALKHPEEGLKRFHPRCLVAMYLENQNE